MAQTVDEIMNRDLFKLRAHDRVEDVLAYLLSLGISAAPVVDDDDRPIGVISWRDLVSDEKQGGLTRRMSSPVDAVAASADIAEAARRMAERNRHHLVCIDDEGRAVGFVSSLDVVRGLTGQPAPHPESFPHWDPRTGMAWTDETRLDADSVLEKAPDAPGLYLLIQPRTGARNQVLWAEATFNVRKQLLDFLTVPMAAPPHLAGPIETGQLWFRAAKAPSIHALREAVQRRHA